MPTIQRLPTEVRLMIAERLGSENLLAPLSRVNKDWEQLCTPVIWSRIRIVCGANTGTSTREVEPTPAEALKDWIPRHRDHLQSVKLKLQAPTSADLDLLQDALAFVPRVDKLDCSFYSDGTQGGHDGYSEGADLLRRVANILRYETKGTRKAKLDFDGIDVRGADTTEDYFGTALVIGQILDRLQPTCEELTYSAPGEILSGALDARLIETILRFPKLKVLSILSDSLLAVQPPETAVQQLESLSLTIRQYRWVSILDNSTAAYGILRPHARTLKHLSLRQCVPLLSGPALQPREFPQLETLTLEDGGVDEHALFRFLIPRACPRLSAFEFFENLDDLAVDQMPEFLDLLPSPGQIKEVRVHPLRDAIDSLAGDEIYLANCENRRALRQVCKSRGIRLIERAEDQEL
ncbi:hypothetical protein JCM10908_001024 [Rhodotorula pacifica]|uniref:uncharacterized protein n=1 Tax=Rhodotorula pacifica TaxID=1495444 RepID=UPI00317668D1